jgi:hypothetical protein
VAFRRTLVGRFRSIEVAGAIVIIIMGLIVLFDLSIFKRLYRLSNIRVNGEEIEQVVLGMALGLVWVPHRTASVEHPGDGRDERPARAGHGPTRLLFLGLAIDARRCLFFPDPSTQAYRPRPP